MKIFNYQMINVNYQISINIKNYQINVKMISI